MKFVSLLKPCLVFGSVTFLSLSSLGMSATLVRPTLMRLSSSRFENSAVIPSIFPSPERQLSRTSSWTCRQAQLVPCGPKAGLITPIWTRTPDKVIYTHSNRLLIGCLLTRCVHLQLQHFYRDLFQDYFHYFV